MEHNEFDDLIKQKLNELSQSGDSDWDDMKDIWQQEQDSAEEDVNQTFDSKLKKEIDGLRVPVKSDHWALMRNALIQEARRKRIITTVKITEIALLFLLSFTVLHFLPIQEETIKLNLETMAEKLEQKVIEVQNIFGVGSNGVATVVSAERIERLSAPSIVIEQYPSSNVGWHVANIVATEINTSEYGRQSELQVLPLASVGVFGKEQTVATPNFLPMLDNKKPEAKLQATVSAGPRVNLVDSPFDPIYQVDAYSTLNTNFDISVLLHKNFEGFGLYGGFRYTDISYAPFRVRETFENEQSEFAQTSLDRIEFKTLTIPLGITLDLVSGKNWGMYLFGGPEFNLITDAEYDIEEKVLGRPAPSSSRNGNASEHARLSQKDFAEGIFNGGAFADNIFFTANVGLGIETMISKNVGLFLQSNYHHFLGSQGIGPNNDRVHGFSIEVGASFDLN